MLKVCLGCGGLIPVTTQGSRCALCQAARLARYAGTMVKPGHVNGWEWGRLRANVLRARPWCAVCAEAGRQTPATQVDHKIRRVDGGTDAPDNLQPLCKACHDVKGRGAGVRPSLMRGGLELRQGYTKSVISKGDPAHRKPGRSPL